MEMNSRKLQRLSGFDYSSENYYYITICTANENSIFGTPENLSIFGEIAEEELVAISSRYEDVIVDKYVIMPNHIHAIIIIGCNGGVERSRPFPTLSTVVGLYKSGVSKRIHEMDSQINVWQKSYYDHVIRGNDDYIEICRYIDENPLKWELDEYNTAKP